MATYPYGNSAPRLLHNEEVVDSDTAQQILASLEAREDSGFPFRMAAMALLDSLPDYNWSGVYRLEGSELHLDAYVGAATDHTVIPVGRGVCGTAISENANQVVTDVRELQNYLACSVQTRSEIVVLIRNGAETLGQIDIDGHRVGAFDRSDEELLTAMAAQIAHRW
jgi:GAF domain-containing protein